IGNFINVRNLQDDSNNYVGRFDWSPTNRDTVWVRYNYVHRFRFVPGTFGGILDGTSSSANGRLTMNGQGASIGWNHNFTPRLCSFPILPSLMHACGCFQNLCRMTGRSSQS